MVDTQTYAQTTRIILRPNRSASWAEVKWVSAIMVAFVMIIALAWSFVGAWVVLPFAGIEVGLMAYFMYRVSRQCHACQVITVAPQKIEIACGVEKPLITQTFARVGTHLTIVEPNHPMDKAKLAISDDHQCFEIGQFLNQQDCQQARESLVRAGLIPISNKWWKSP